MHRQLQSTSLYMVNHYVKIWHVRLGVANNMRQLGSGAQTENIQFFLRFAVNLVVSFLRTAIFSVELYFYRIQR